MPVPSAAPVANGAQSRVPPATPPRPPSPPVTASRAPSTEAPAQANGSTHHRLMALVSDIMQPQDSDDYAKGPAIVLRPEYFGGRTRIGTPLSAFRRILYLVAGAMFSWLYFIPLIRSTLSKWEFLPFAKTEYVRITLRQRILWARVLPIFFIWGLCLFAMNLVGILFALIAPFLGALLMLASWVLANLVAAFLLRLSADRLARSQITLSYGFPVKYPLLQGVSDAPLEQQLEGVLQLCQALGRSEFGRWDQFTSHGTGGGGMFNAIFNRLGSLLPGRG
jgi:hypothetical protein